MKLLKKTLAFVLASTMALGAMEMYQGYKGMDVVKADTTATAPHTFHGATFQVMEDSRSADKVEIIPTSMPADLGNFKYMWGREGDTFREENAFSLSDSTGIVEKNTSNNSIEIIVKDLSKNKLFIKE